MIREKNMLRKEFTIENEVGLHARPASVLVQTANRFVSTITIKRDSENANAKSIINVLSLGVEKGTKITIEIEGEDEKEAMEAITSLIKNNFGEKK